MRTQRRNPIHVAASVWRLVGVGCMLALAQVASAQTTQFRDPASVPPSWTQFSRLVKYRFEEWLGSNDPIAARFRAYLKIHAGASDGAPETLVVQAWINPDGSVQRVAFPALGDPGATKDLQTILSRGSIGERPPPEMLQPIRLRFNLSAAEK